ncbi:MAG TPA: PIG-L deacetylase family protein [Nocardioidaceae bacterium]|nr:PIG-L deacetylase family protein [Nocardioidaceae bacterium]
MTPDVPPVQPSPDQKVERVLVVSAHPDDVDFGAAGTVATWTDAEIIVTYCIITDGQAGGFELSTPRDAMVDIRRTEQRAAASVVGVDDVRFLGYVDGELVATQTLVGQLTRAIREVRPQRMVVPSPERDYARIYRSHPDHLAAGDAALRAIYPAARNPFAFPELLDEGLAPWTVDDTWLMAHPSSNHAVDISAVIDRKIAAVMAHTSQHEYPEERSSDLRQAFAGDELGFGANSYAEGFFVVPTA